MIDVVNLISIAAFAKCCKDGYKIETYNGVILISSNYRNILLNQIQYYNYGKVSVESINLPYGNFKIFVDYSIINDEIEVYL
jgi:hypothetical protein